MAWIVREAPAAKEAEEGHGQARRLTVRSVQSLGPWLVVAGGVLMVVGLLAWAGLLGWFGHLPGDIRIERGSVRIYVPIVSLLLVSFALSGILALVRRL